MSQVTFKYKRKVTKQVYILHTAACGTSAALLLSLIRLWKAEFDLQEHQTFIESLRVPSGIQVRVIKR